MKNFFKSRTIQAALLATGGAFAGVIVTIIYSTTTFSVDDGQLHAGEGDNVYGDKVQNVYLKESLPETVDQTEPILVNVDYQCGDEVCSEEYIKIGQDQNFIYFDRPECKSYKLLGYHFDTGAAESSTGSTKIITDWQVEEIRNCSWISIPISHIVHIENLLFATSTKKTIGNYQKTDMFGSIILE